MSQRLNLIVETFEKGTKASFARKVGISAQGAQEILAGRKGDPSFKVLVKIIDAYPQVRMEWLVMGTGPMLQGEAEQQSTPTLSPEQLNEAIDQISASQLSRQHTEELASMLNRQIADMQSSLRQAEKESQALRQNIVTVMAEEHLDEKRQQLLSMMQEDYVHSSVQVAQRRKALEPLQHAADQMEKIALAVTYRITGNPDISKPYGGLLAYRLGISESLAKQLVDSNKIPALIANGEPCVSEKIIQEFLDKPYKEYLTVNN